MEDKEVILQVEDLSLELSGKLILEEISFSLKEQEILVLMGKNGCGKSVLFKSLVGIYPPQKGKVYLFGEDFYSLPKIKRNELLKKVGYVFQKSGLFDSMSVLENVLFPLERFFSSSKKVEFRKKAVEILHQVGLKEVEELYPSSLSGGMQKRVGIARAVIHEPKLLIMDDPTAGLDPVLTDAIADLILEMKNLLKATLLISTHEFPLAYKVATKIALMVQGKIVAIKETQEFQESKDPFIMQFREGLLEGPIAVIE